MKKIGHITINIGKKPFGKYKVISERAYTNDVVAQIQFTNQDWIWIPIYSEIGSIVEALLTAENINRVNRGWNELSMRQNLHKMGISLNSSMGAYQQLSSRKTVVSR